MSHRRGGIFESERRESLFMYTNWERHGRISGGRRLSRSSREQIAKRHSRLPLVFSNSRRLMPPQPSPPRRPSSYSSQSRRIRREHPISTTGEIRETTSTTISSPEAVEVESGRGVKGVAPLYSYRRADSERSRPTLGRGCPARTQLAIPAQRDESARRKLSS